jgi:hypothetical protein
MEELTFYNDGRVAYRLFNQHAGTTEASGSFTLSCPQVAVTLTNGYWAGTNLSLSVDARGMLQNGNRWSKCDGACF